MNNGKFTWMIDHLTTCLAAIQDERRHDPGSCIPTTAKWTEVLNCKTMRAPRGW